MSSDKVAAIEECIDAILSILGVKATESNKDTPKRVAKMYVNELFKNTNENVDEFVNGLTTFPYESNGYGTPVKVKTSVKSMCEHHLMPFFGKVTVEYIPSDKIIGLSKIPRLVDFLSRKPTLQENLTEQIADCLDKLLSPKYLKVTMVCTHTCVELRGAEKPCKTKTIAERGERNGKAKIQKDTEK